MFCITCYNYVFNLCYTVYEYFVCKNIYNNPIDDIELDDDFINNKIEFSKIINSINNNPQLVHNILVDKYDYIFPEYFKITITFHENGFITLEQNDEIYDHMERCLDNNNIRFIYIGVQLVSNTFINHMNCIIIDKKQKYVLYFEPKVFLKINIDAIRNFIEQWDEMKHFEVIEPKDIGYGFFNALQHFDFYCQTYVILAFLLIINNEDTEYKNFSKLFNLNINNEIIGKFIYYIKQNYDKNNIIPGDPVIIWNYPKNTFVKYYNCIMIASGNNYKKKLLDEIDTSKIKEDTLDDFIVIYEDFNENNQLN